MNKNYTFNIAVCEGRHDIPEATNGSIFPSTIPEDALTNPDRLEHRVIVWFLTHLLNTPELKQAKSDSIQINLYVTGLTVATLAIVSVCHMYGFKLTCWHYNKETGSYYPQIMR